MKRRATSSQAVPRLPDIFSNGIVSDWLERDEPVAWARYEAMPDGPSKRDRMYELGRAAYRLRNEAFRDWVITTGLSWRDPQVRALMPRGPVFWTPRAERQRDLALDAEETR